MRNLLITSVAAIALAGCVQTEQLSADLENMLDQLSDSSGTETARPIKSKPPKECDLQYNFFAKNDWPAIWRGCKGSEVAAANASTYLLKQGEHKQAKDILEKAIQWHPNNPTIIESYKFVSDPFNAVATLTESRLNAWLTQPSQHGVFKESPPNKATLPPLPELIKGEFETKADFQKRVESERLKRKDQVTKVEQDYLRDISNYNEAVTAYNAKLDIEKKERQKAIPAMRMQIMGETFREVFGRPYFDKPIYDAETQTFSAILKSENENFEEPVTISVPIAEGAAFKQDIQNVGADISFNVDNNTIRLADIKATHRGQFYTAYMSDGNIQNEVIKFQLAEASVDNSATRLSTLKPNELDAGNLLDQNDAYFNSVNFEEDPELAKQRQQLAELQRKKQEQADAAARNAEKERLQKQLEQLQSELADTGDAIGDEYKGLVAKTSWSFKQATPNKDMVAVVIGNRDYSTGIPLVHYAKNDAKAVREYLTKGMGVAPENIIYEENATKGNMDAIFERVLRNRVTPAKTDVFVYFSGHGMPVGEDARLLPSDSRPNTADITGYSRDKMMAQLASLDAKSLTVVLDSCFTGNSKDGKALIAAKAFLPEPKSAILPENATLITASKGNQTAWSDDEKGHSLLTYHTLEGLNGKADKNQDNQISTAELQTYLSENVNRASLLKHQLPQEPEISGVNRILTSY